MWSEWLVPGAAALLLLALLLLLAARLLRRRERAAATAAPPPSQALDTLQAWPPESVRVLSIHERQGYDLLRRALPGFMVLAQVPLARFIRVPTRHSYTEWLNRVGALRPDLLLCDASSRVLAVVDLRPANLSERAQRRHDRMLRVLRAAGIGAYVWTEGALPSVADIRASIGRQLGAAGSASAANEPVSRSGEVRRLLAAGDAAHDQADNAEPVPSAFFDDADPRR